MAYSDVILADSPVGYWKLDETSGTVATDSSTNSNNGTIAGTPTMGANGLVFEPSGKCIDLDGVDDGVNISSPPAISGGTASFECWVKTSELASTSKYLLDGNPNRFVIGWNTSTSGKIGVYDGAWKNFGDAPNDGITHHLVFVLDNTVAKLFVDGVQFGSNIAITAISWGSLSTLKLANAYNSYSSGFTGKYQHAAIYDDALTPLQISQHYQAGIAQGFHKTALDLSPSLYLPLNEISGAPQDWSGNDNNGVITGDITQGVTGLLASESSTAYEFSGVDGEIAITHPASTTTYSLFAALQLDSATGEYKILEDDSVGHWSIKDGKQNLNYSSSDHLSTSVLPTSEAAFIGISVDAGAVTFYNAGAADGTATGAIALDFETISDALASFDGKLQCLLRFPTALTAANHLALYDSAAKFFGIRGNITESLAATDFYVRASELGTGAFIGDAVMQGDNTYTFDFSEITGYETYADEVLLTCLPKTGKRRLDSTAYSVGDYYLPADVTTNDHIYKVTVAGTTASSEPTLDQAGGTTVDGTVTVQDMGVCPTPITQISYAETIEL